MTRNAKPGIAHIWRGRTKAAGDASVVLPLDFLRLPLIALVGWLFYGEKIDIFVVLGAGAIIAGVLWNLRDESRRGAMTARTENDLSTDPKSAAKT